VAGGEDEAITIEPAGLGGVVHQRVAVEGRADFGGAKGKPQVAGGALMNGIDGETPGLVGGLGKNFSLQFHERGEKELLPSHHAAGKPILRDSAQTIACAGKSPASGGHKKASLGKGSP